MNKLVGWALAIGGGYVVMKAMGYDPFSLVNSEVDEFTTTNANNPHVSQNTLELVKSKARGEGVDPGSYQSVHVWNYFYKKVRGIDALAPEELFPGNDSNRLYSVEEWWNSLSGKGFSGLGLIANKVNPYWNPSGNPTFNNMFPNRSETYNVRFG